MTEEEINQYLELEKKIKKRIVQISKYLSGVSIESMRQFLSPDITQRIGDFITDIEDFIDTDDGNYLLFCIEEDRCDDYFTCEFNKKLLCIDDETLVKIKDYETERIRKKEEVAKLAEEEHKKKLAKEVEEKEYQQYLKLKKKFEKKEIPNKESIEEAESRKRYEGRADYESYMV